MLRAIFLVCIVTALMPLPALAAQIISSSDTVTRHEPGVASDHRLSLTLGNAIVAGEIFTFEFSQHDVSSITNSDVLITLQTATSSVVFSNWTFSPTATDSFSVTFNSAIAAGSTVLLDIGSEAGGANQILNPSSQGSHEYRINSSVDAIVAIGLLPITRDTVGVSATIKEVVEPTVSGGTCASSRCVFGDQQEDGLTLSLFGWSHPNGTVYAIYGGGVIGTARADIRGYFSFNINDLPADTESVWLYSLDQTEERNAFSELSLDLVEDALNEYRGIGLSPTLFVQPTSENTYDVSGWTVSNGLVTLRNSLGVVVALVQADASGYFQYEYDMEGEVSSVFLYAQSELGAVDSQDSLRVTLRPFDSRPIISPGLPPFLSDLTPEESESEQDDVSEQYTPQTLCLVGDISSNEIVDLADMSVWAYWRDRPDEFRTRMASDTEDFCLNRDDKFDLADISIISYYWQQRWPDISRFDQQGRDRI